MGTASVAPLLRCFSFVLAARRPATPLYLYHPRRGPAAALASTARQAFDRQDCLLDLRAFVAEFRDHLQIIHAGKHMANSGAAAIGYIQFNMLSDGIEEYMDLMRANEADAGASS